VAYDAKGKAIKAVLEWKSSKPSVASVDEKTGKLKAKKAGTAKLTATSASGKKVTITVNVVKKAKAIKKLSLVKPPKTLKAGKTAVLRLKLSPSGATYKPIVFKSKKPSVVSVDKAGRLTANKKGKAVITVKAGSRYVRWTVTVK
jgi:uncharacterized protein YjdB